MGLERMAQAEFTDAYHILTPHCREKQTYAPVLVACGTLHETFASLTGGPMLRLHRTSGPDEADDELNRAGTLSWAARQLSAARSARKQELRARARLPRAGTAPRFFAFRSDSSSRAGSHAAEGRQRCR